MIPLPAILSRLPAWIPFYLHISIVYLPNKIIGLRYSRSAF
jgi:hypothetical protein